MTLQGTLSTGGGGGFNVEKKNEGVRNPDRRKEKANRSGLLRRKTRDHKKGYRRVKKKKKGGFM